MSDDRPRYSPYIEISLDNVLHNAERVRTLLPRGVDICAVVKDCSYGCGSVMIAKTLEYEGVVSFFAVARAREAAALRKAGLASPILVLGMASEDEMRFGSNNNIKFALNDLDDVRRFGSYTFDIRAHVNVDTGMSRMGVLPSEVPQLTDMLKDAPNVCLEGAFTHMACADEPGTETVGLQFDKFRAALGVIKSAGITLDRVHYCNSAAFIRFPVDAGLSGGGVMVRPGIALYGCRPDPAQDFGAGLLPVASLKSSVIKMKKVPAGTRVSYGWNYEAAADTWIATIPLGYAHGLPRFLSGRGEVLIGGKRYRIAGNVTMDYIMVDAGADPVISVGDEVTAIGKQGDDEIAADEVALLGGTIGYEIICNLGTAIDRYYLRGGKTVHHDPGVIF